MSAYNLSLGGPLGISKRVRVYLLGGGVSMAALTVEHLKVMAALTVEHANASFWSST